VSGKEVTDPARLYYRDDPDAVVLRALDGLSLLYHRPSGITHIVDSPVPEILAALGLAGQPQSANALLDRLCAEYDLEGGVEGLEQHLDTLVALGLARVAL
jgi:PqqD family protein of HPr-rel-A system